MLGHTMGAGKVDGENQIGICRVCMASKPDQVCIFNELNLSSKLIELADIQVVEGDGLPSAICTDCEADLQRCYEFRVQVRWADQKLRESSVSQIDVEECNIKLERDHGVCEKINERNDSDIEDYSAENESHCDLDETMNDTEDNIYPQVSHVEVAENKREDISMINDPLGLDEPLIEAAHMKSDVGSADDPLKFVKIETTEPMETDNFGASTSASTSSAVNRTVTSKLLQILPAISNTGGKFGGKGELVTPSSEVTRKHSRNLCSFFGCGRSKARHPTLHFFTFPVNRQSICDAWIMNCANEMLDMLSKKTLSRKVVCEMHFEDSCFLSTMKRRLQPNAIPTISSAQDIDDALSIECKYGAVKHEPDPHVSFEHIEIKQEPENAVQSPQDNSCQLLDITKGSDTCEERSSSPIPTSCSNTLQTLHSDPSTPPYKKFKSINGDQETHRTY